jgi:hypothetical protein
MHITKYIEGIKLYKILQEKIFVKHIDRLSSKKNASFCHGHVKINIPFGNNIVKFDIFSLKL